MNDLFIGKTHFRRENPNYDDSIIVGEFPKKRSIDSSFLSEKDFWPETPFKRIFSKKIFPQKIFKSSKK